MNPIVTVTGFWDAFITKIAVFLPNLFFAVAIILLGWVICNVIKRVVVRLLENLPIRYSGGARRHQNDSREGRDPSVAHPRSSDCWSFGSCF